MIFSQDKLKDFDPNDVAQLESLLKVHVLYHIGRVAKNLQVDQASFDEKWNKTYQTDVVKVAHAHAVYMTATSFIEGFKSTEMTPSLKKNVEILLKIHLAHSIVTYADGAILSGYAKAKHLIRTEEFLYEQMELIRPQLLNIVEAFDYPDGGINSVIGKDSDKTYEKIFLAASSNPMNRTDKLDSVDQYLKPLARTLSARL